MKNQVLEAFRHLLRPLIRVLLRNGLTWREFSELSKEVFVEVAREDYGIEGRPTNDARVALMTGLGRHQVAQIKMALAQRRPPEAAPTRISQILTAWHVDPEFLDAKGSPAELPLTGDGPNLTDLIKRYAGDLPHSVVLKELERLGLVERRARKFSVTSRDYIRSAADPDLIRQASIALHDHATTIAHNLDSSRSGPPRLERMATTHTLPHRHVRPFQKFLDGEARAFLERTDAWLAARSEPAAGDLFRRGRRSTVRTGVGVFLIHDVAEEENSHGVQNP